VINEQDNNDYLSIKGSLESEAIILSSFNPEKVESKYWSTYEISRDKLVSSQYPSFNVTKKYNATVEDYKKMTIPLARPIQFSERP
jgi:hypothetical protein